MPPESMTSFSPFLRPPTFSALLRAVLLVSAVAFLLYLLRFSNPFLCPSPPAAADAPAPSPAATSVHHLLFGVASSARSWPRRCQYLRLWWRPGLTSGAVFLDAPARASSGDDCRGLLPTRVSADTSRFPYTFKGGLRSSIRVARIVKELVDAVENGSFHGDEVRWIVLGDDDTVFVPENLARTLGKYDWEQRYYVGGRSENLEQNMKYSFNMAFGGGGFAISYPLAKVLSKVLDSCLVRYAHLYGSDARIFSCLAELGVSLTHEPGFHQVDLRGDISGMLSAHSLTPLVSLHHLDIVEPLFPDMNRTEALKQLFKSVNVDPGRTLQQMVCYDRVNVKTISISWGYVIHVFEGNQLLPDLLSASLSFTPWKRNRNASSSLYMFNTREFTKDPCKRPASFYLESLISDNDNIISNYARLAFINCSESTSQIKNLKQIRVFSQQSNNQPRQAARRECCDVLLSSSETKMEINIRKCKEYELIAMHP